MQLALKNRLQQSLIKESECIYEVACNTLRDHSQANVMLLDTTRDTLREFHRHGLIVAGETRMFIDSRPQPHQSYLQPRNG